MSGLRCPATDRLLALLARAGRDVPLAEALLLVAQGEYPALDVARELARIEALALEARLHLGPAPAPRRESALALAGFLAAKEGFRGNASDYYDPRNSYLNDVLERRLGIPISLAVIHVEVGRRAGLRPEPVSFPGHFLVKHDLPEGGTLVLDPFHGGRVVSREVLEARLRQATGLEVPFLEKLLRAAEPREVIARALRNLKEIYAKRGDAFRAHRVVDQLVAVRPASREDRRERGLLAARLGRYALALEDLVPYARALPDSQERRRLAAEIETMRRKAAELN